jgi:hypothetical protein
MIEFRQSGRKNYFLGLSGIATAAVFYFVQGERLALQSPTQIEAPPADVAPIRMVPLYLPPHGDLADTVNDKQLRVVLSAARPYWSPPSVSYALHAVRLWGKDSHFPPARGFPNGLHCRDLIKFLTNNDEFRRVSKGTFNAFLVDTPYGIRSLASQDPVHGSAFAEGHYDQLLKVLGEAGVIGDSTVVTASGKRGSVADLARDSIMRFSLDQELEFTASAYARWLEPGIPWRNRFGQTFCFDDLADSLVRRPLGNGACKGCHVPYALTSLLAADGITRMLSSRSRIACEKRLVEVALLLEANELSFGGWDKTWSGTAKETQDSLFFDFKPQFDRIMCTGHHLEWIAFAPSAARPSRTVIYRAVEALSAEVSGLSLDDRAKYKGYLPITHAARALVSMRAEAAFAVWNDVNLEPESSTKPERDGSK